MLIFFHAKLLYKIKLLSSFFIWCIFVSGFSHCFLALWVTRSSCSKGLPFTPPTPGLPVRLASLVVGQTSCSALAYHLEYPQWAASATMTKFLCKLAERAMNDSSNWELHAYISWTIIEKNCDQWVVLMVIWLDPLKTGHLISGGCCWGKCSQDLRKGWKYKDVFCANRDSGD